MPVRVAALRRRQVFLTAALLWLLLLPAVAAYALRIPAEEPTRRVYVHTFWNLDYLCLAARVPDTIITGTSNQPMSTPEQDDAIEFDFLLPSGVGHRLIISAAEGMTMLTREPSGNWRSDNAWVRGPRTIKYAVGVNGTLNKPQDTDTEFVVELAIPWEFLEGMPEQVIKPIGFNVVNWMQGDNNGLVSWSPYITSGAEVGDTSRWGQMLITRSSVFSVAQGMTCQSPYAGVDPFIDAKLNADEWMTSSTLSFEKPKPEFTPAPQEVLRKNSFEALMAIYRYDWEPGLFWKNGAPATIDQPKEGAGPWYRAGRVDWHRNQLAEVKRAGIEVILVHYQGDPESRLAWARSGLDRLTQALKEMRAEGKSYPLVGLYLDTAALRGVDLKSDAGKQLVTMMIRDFFLHVPREFRAELGAKPEAGRRGGVPVLLGEPAGLADWDESFMAYAEGKLGRITWLASSAWREKGGKKLYAYLRLGGAGLTQEAAGSLTAFTLSPGYCPPPGVLGEVRSRRDGRAYRTDWQRVIASSPSLVLIDSWNDFASATEIAASRQYGFEFVDATRVARAQLGYGQPRHLRLLQHSLPEVLRPGADYQAELIIENDGTEDVATGRLTTADYRITRRSDGKAVYERINAQDLKLLAGQIKRVPVVITTRGDRGEPLPAGDYVFTLVVMRSRVPLLRSKLVSRPEAELSVPFTVGTPGPYQGTIISTSLPSSMPDGGTETVTVRVRNDGAETWKAGQAALTYGWRLADDGVESSAQVSVGGLGWRPERVPLRQDAKPGETVSVMVPVAAREAELRNPLMAQTAPPLWHYAVEWGLETAQDSAATTRLGAVLGREAISIVPADPAAVIESAEVPKTVTAGETFAVPVVVGNGSTQVWPAAQTTLTPQWYRWDGRAVDFAAAPVPFPADVLPSQKTTVTANVAAPPVAGSYWLAWQVNGAAQGRWRDLLVTPVTVTGGGFRPVDLTEAGNCVGVTADAYRGRGDFDGNGRSLPSECLPPDQSGAGGGRYPDGYYAPATTTGLPVPFVYPNMETGMGTAVACAGQSIALGEKGARKIHLLAAGVGATQEITVGLRGADGADLGTATVHVPSWREAAESAAAMAPYVRTLNGDDGSLPAYLHHLVIESRNGAAVTMVLPKAADVRVLAITVEE